MFSVKIAMVRPIILRSAATSFLPWLLVCGAFAQKSGRVEDGIKLALPFHTWGVRLDNPGAVVEYREMKSGRQAYLLASHPKNGITVSITIENVSQPPEPGECRRSLEARKESFGAPSGLRFSRVTGKSRGPEMPPSADVMEFLLDQNEFAALHQKNLLVCLTRDNAFIDIHMSKVNFVPADQALMEEVLGTVGFVDADLSMAPTVESSTELMAQGSRRYLARDYKGAIPFYERALEVEELKQRLSPDMWHVLVDNLGMSFAFTGNLGAAEGVFRYGVSKDPNYAMFHYNLACAHAEKNDMAGAMQELRIAFRNRATMIKGESMPDPTKDDSFSPFMSNAEFIQFLKELR
jgi:hypothetical protein